MSFAAVPAVPASLLAELAIPEFQPRVPWLGADLQTLRDTVRFGGLGPDRGIPQTFVLPDGEQLLAFRDPPRRVAAAGADPGDPPPEGLPRGWVLLLHGLGGSSSRGGVRRLGQSLQGAGFGVLRLNLRGAGAGRGLARGTYAARCNSDLLPVLHEAAAFAAPAPLLAVGLSLGGTVLLNAALAAPGLLAGLACVSSPLDLAGSSARIEQPRNRFYQHWLLERLIAQTLADPLGVTPAERACLQGAQAPSSIRAFDAAITAPRWGYSSVEEYYREASPLPALRAALEAAPGSAPALPPTLLVHALDDPWVPADATAALARRQLRPPLAVVLTDQGGHNGFHGRGDTRTGSWADRLVCRWLERLTG